MPQPDQLSPSSKPTVVDVAVAAGVAVGTVSRVLNTPDLVGGEIREKVLNAIDRMNYRPLRQRRRAPPKETDKKRRLGNVGVLMIGMDDSLTHLPVISETLHGVELALSAANENLLLANVPGADRVPAFLARKLVDGLIIKSPLLGNFRECASPELVEAIEQFPRVWLIGRPEAATGDVVGCDNDEGGRMAAEYLFSKGHRHVGYLHPRPGQTRSEGLKHSFSRHAQRLKMSVDYFEGPRTEKVQWPLPAITNTADLIPLLDQWEQVAASKRPTAMLVAADSIAVQLYSALQQRGLTVGRELSILSFNHEKPLVAGLDPHLTTIDIQAEAIGRRAVDQLRWQIMHPAESLPTKILIQPRLVEGGSVATIKR